MDRLNSTTILHAKAITKSFTATGVALLHNEGRLDWTKPVHDYLPEFRLHDAVATERVTVVGGGIILMVLGITLPVPFWAEEIAETIGLLTVVTGAVGCCPLKPMYTQRGQKPGSSS